MGESLSILDHYLSVLRTAVSTSSLHKKVIAERASIHPNSLNNMGDPAWAPSVHTMRQLEGVILLDAQRSQVAKMLRDVFALE